MRNTVLILMSLIVTTLCQAQKSEIFEEKGIALAGYDVVAFFQDGKAIKGSREFSTEWKKSLWYFNNDKNLKSFQADPERFVPQYGGYCAYGAAEGHKAATQADTWTIIDNKLYFNYNRKVKELWMKDTPGYIKSADRNWEKIKHSE